MEPDCGEQSRAGVGVVQAGREIGVDASGFTDAGDQSGNIPWAGSQQEECVELAGCDQKAAVAGSRPCGRLADRPGGLLGLCPVQCRPGGPGKGGKFAAAARCGSGSLDGGGQMPMADSLRSVGGATVVLRRCGFADLGSAQAQVSEPHAANQRRCRTGAETRPMVTLLCSSSAIRVPHSG